MKTNKYENTKIFCLRSNKTDQKYYDYSNDKLLSSRMANLKFAHRQWEEGLKDFKPAFKLLEYDDCIIELVEILKDTSLDEVKKRLNEIIRADPNAVNKM